MKRALFALALLAACADAPTQPKVPLGGIALHMALGYTCVDSVFTPPPPPPPPPPPSGIDGQVVFVQQCAQCHSSRDGFDLAYFSYADSTIIRRALGHVGLDTAQAVSVYILGLSTPHVAEIELIFQPGTVIAGGTNATGDVNFAVAAFGSNGWPASYTRADVLAIDPKQFRVALPLLPWSDETNTREWLPKDSLPPAILSFNGNAAANALASYYASPSIAGLEAFDAAVKTASINLSNTIAPCQIGQMARTNFTQCFEIRRWVASLTVTHKLRNGGTFLSPALYLQWWNVGKIAQLSRGFPPSQGGGQLVDYLQQQVRWMYLGWMFDVPNEPAIYGTEGFRTLQMPRHATWKALRSIVARFPGVFTETESPYTDFKEVALSTPSGTAWSFNAGRFGLDELLRRLNLGDRPPTAAERTTATSQLNSAMTTLQPKVSAAEYTILNALADQIRAGLQ